jgi:hypothetical protein
MERGSAPLIFMIQFAMFDNRESGSSHPDADDGAIQFPFFEIPERDCLGPSAGKPTTISSIMNANENTSIFDDAHERG